MTDHVAGVWWNEHSAVDTHRRLGDVERSALASKVAKGRTEPQVSWPPACSGVRLLSGAPAAINAAIAKLNLVAVIDADVALAVDAAIPADTLVAEADALEAVIFPGACHFPPARRTVGRREPRV